MNYSFNDLTKVLVPYKKNTINLEPGTIIKIPFKGELEEFVILGVNVNPNPSESDNFIDIMSTRLLLEDVSWKKEFDGKVVRYNESDLKKELEAQKQYFPQEIQDAIIPRTVRFVSNITSKLNYELMNIGDIWVPSLKEIIGDAQGSDADDNCNQYPYFKNIMVDRKVSPFDETWWTRSSLLLNVEHSYVFTYRGECRSWVIYNTYNAPLCLRLNIAR